MTITDASGTSTPTSITVVATSTSMRPDRNSAMTRSFSAERQLAVQEPDPQPGRARWPASRSASATTEVACDPVRPFDQWAHDERPVAGGRPRSRTRAHASSASSGVRSHVGGHRLPARGQLVDDGHVEIAEDHHGRSAREWASPS